MCNWALFFSSLKATPLNCSNLKPCDLKNCKLKADIPGVTNNFIVHFKIGSGTFGCVYVATLKQRPSELFALKHIQPCCSPRRILNEIKHLTLINSEYVISLETFFRHNDHVVLVMPFFEHGSFQDYFKDLTITEVKVYMKSLFLAVKALHSHGVVHRDIKPSNVLFNRKSKKLKLIDFGLSQEGSVHTDFCSTNHCSQISGCCSQEICSVCMAKPSQSTPRAGTSGFRAFEVLLKCPNQSFALDIWSVGIIFLSLLSGKYPFFKGRDDMASIMQIIVLFGSTKCVETARLLGKKLYCSPPQPSQNISTICQHMRHISLAENKSIGDSHSISVERKEETSWITAPPAAYELLLRCLDLNFYQRITATQAVYHPFLSEF